MQETPTTSEPVDLISQTFRLESAELEKIKYVTPLQYPSEQLRMLCQPILVIDDDVKMLVKVMAKTIIEFGGIGLAANQIGFPYQVIVIDTTGKHDFLALINPEIVERSEENIDSYEACLSVPTKPAKLKRSKSVTVTALDLNGSAIKMEVKDFGATVFQHEIDHLHGVLFVDRVEGVKRTLIDKKLKQLKREREKRVAKNKAAQAEVEKIRKQDAKKKTQDQDVVPA